MIANFMVGWAGGMSSGAGGAILITLVVGPPHCTHAGKRPGVAASNKNRHFGQRTMRRFF
jgi:hypothetical protein